MQHKAFTITRYTLKHGYGKNAYSTINSNLEQIQFLPP